MDFRTEAADATLARLPDASAAALASLGESGCVPVPGGRRVQVGVEIPFIILSFVCLIGAVSALPLTQMKILPRQWAIPVLLIGLLISLTFRWVKSVILKMYLAARADSLLKALPDLSSIAVGLENAATHKQTKWVVEDEGVCLLDPQRQRVLIEGCSFRYVFYAHDVYLVEPVSGYAMSGARVSCRMAGQEFNVVLMARGHGPIASLVQTVSPSSGAANLASKLNGALFGQNLPTHRQGALPPELPV